MIVYKGRRYDYIEEFDGKVIRLRFNEGGSMITVLPISPKYHRYNHPTEAYVNLEENENSVTFYIQDDWGKRHVIEIGREHQDWIDYAKNNLVNEGLLDHDKHIWDY